VQRGIEGTVQVVVSLDADSHQTGDRIQRSPNAILNDVSLEAARHSTFQTAIRNCVPVAADYIFSVEFARVRS
jgi:outer membrane biosynthesis protein TonB